MMMMMTMMMMVVMMMMMMMMIMMVDQMKTSPQRMLRARSMKFAVSSKKSVIGAAGRS